MREMVLNHASVFAPESDREVVSAWLRDLARGMAKLVQERVVQSSIRMTRWYDGTPCLPDYSLWQAVDGLRVNGLRDEYLFLTKLSAKIPLLSEVGEDIEDRFLFCEERRLPGRDGEPLVFCAIADGVVVGFPSSPEWDRDRVVVDFSELLPDETIEPTSEEVDQLTRSAHAGVICNRHRARLHASSDDPASLWENRGAAFPYLSFGPGVQDNLRGFAHLLPAIVGKLVDLDGSARDWRERGGPAPVWRTKVTPESQPLMDNPKLREARRFPSNRGTRELFEWHARFGGNGRIHLRFDPRTREVEIGYIGRHLPL